MFCFGYKVCFSKAEIGSACVGFFLFVFIKIKICQQYYVAVNGQRNVVKLLLMFPADVSLCVCTIYNSWDDF